MPRLGMKIRPSHRRPIRLEPLLQVASRPGTNMPFCGCVAFALEKCHEQPDFQNMTLEAAVENLTRGVDLATSLLREHAECDCQAHASYAASALASVAALCAYIGSEMRLFPEGPSLPPVAIHEPPGSDPDGC